MKDSRSAAVKAQARARRPGVCVARVLILLLLFLMILMYLSPFAWMLISSFKTNREILLDPFALPNTFSFENYITVWNIGMGRYFLNSIVVTAGTCLLTTFASSLAAFALSRYRFRGNHFWFMYLLCGMMLATQVSLISNYQLLRMLHLYDTLWALILVHTAFRIPFTMFMLWSYFMTLSKDIEEAACLEGCSSFMIFWRIILPVSRPIIATSILLTARTAWNDFMFSLVFTSSSELKTIPYGLQSLKTEFGIEYGRMMAGMTIATIPIIILFLCVQKQFIRGMTVGAVKE